MAGNKFSLDSLDALDLRTGGINDLPELAVEIHPNAGNVQGASPVAPERTHQTALAIEESRESSAVAVTDPPALGPVPKGFVSLLRKVRSTLPVVARILPLLDSGVAAALAPVTTALAPPPTANTKAIERSITEVRSAQRELRTNLQSHTLQLRRVDEQLVRMREEAEQQFREQQEKLEQVRSAVRMIKIVGLVAVLLLLIVLGLEGWILLHPAH
jgi:hypothetical protein